MYCRIRGSDPSVCCASSLMISEKPMIALSGVRSSWVMLARNLVLARSAAWACRIALAQQRRPLGVLLAPRTSASSVCRRSSSEPS